MTNYLNIITTFLLLISTGMTSYAQKEFKYTSLDEKHRINIQGDSISCGLRGWKLNKHTLFLDGRLTEDEIREISPYAFNNFKDINIFLENRRHDKTTQKDTPTTILVAPWVYWIDDPDDAEIRKSQDGTPIGMTVKCERLRIIGLTSDARNVVFASARGQTQGAIGNFTMFDFYGDSLHVENLTMGNYCNVDLIYTLHPTLSRPKRSATITQAQVAFAHGKGISAYNCHFVSRLNLCPLSGAENCRYDKCHFECTDDALNGSGIYTSCDFDFYAPKPLWSTDESGAIFSDCDFYIRHDNKEQYFCKHPGTVTVTNSRFHAPEGTYIGWSQSQAEWLRCYQDANITLNGKPITIGQRNISNTVFINQDRLSNDYDELILLDKHSAELRTGKDTITLKARILKKGFGKFPIKQIKWKAENTFQHLVSLYTTNDNECVVIPENDGETPVKFCVLAYTDDGLEAACEITVLPKSIPAPTFINQPKIRIENGVAHIDYTLDLQGRKDMSDITLYRYDTLDGQSETVSISPMDKPERTYRLTPDDKGKFIMATIKPKNARSEYGNIKAATTNRTINDNDIIVTDTWETDFHNFPYRLQPEIRNGSWTVDGFKPKDTTEYPWNIEQGKDYWIYGTGINGCKGEGLLQTAQGARLLYTPLPGSYGDMEIVLNVDPSKTAGQGFSSATGQYMDIYIKFDTYTLSGYALRIERTVKHSNAVDFTLMRYDNGIATPISESTTSTCYRTDCTIIITAQNDMLYATASTTTPQPQTGLATSVSLKAKIKPNDFGGTGIQHTGTTGEGTTMLHRLRITRERR